jgi:hypothetical protein
VTTPQGPNGHRPSPQDMAAAQQAAMAQQAAAMAQMAAEIEAQVQEASLANVATLKGLMAQGIRMDPLQVLDMRINLLMRKVAEVLGPQGQVWLASVNLSFEQHMAEVLANAKEQGTMAVLGAGGTLSATAIRDLAKATKTYGG